MHSEEFRVGDLTEVRGKWWNPLSKERVTSGTLTLSDDEPVLTYDYRSDGSEGDWISFLRGPSGRSFRAKTLLQRH